MAVDVVGIRIKYSYRYRYLGKSATYTSWFCFLIDAFNETKPGFTQEHGIRHTILL